MKSPQLEKFLNKIMTIKVLRSGGASAGIFGHSGADSETVNNLKKSAVAFAYEYSKPKRDSRKLDELSNDIFGHIQTLQLTYSISEKEADALMKDMQALLDRK